MEDDGLFKEDDGLLVFGSCCCIGAPIILFVLIAPHITSNFYFFPSFVDWCMIILFAIILSLSIAFIIILNRREGWF